MRGRIKQAFLAALLSLLCSCRQTEYVTVPVRDTAYAVREVHDSVFTDRWHTVRESGDTVFVRDSVYLSRVLWRHDTLRVYEERPVEVPRVVVREVEKELSWLQRALIYIGIASLAFLAIRTGWSWLKRHKTR